MGRGIVKLAEDKYVEWSTVVDAPISEVFNHKEAQFKIGADFDRLDRLNETGTTFVNRTAEDFLSFNRAGENESHLTAAEIVELYTEKTTQKDTLVLPIGNQKELTKS